MEILYVKLTWFSAESSQPVILVLYFTLIWGVTSDAPRRISANIQMKAPPQRLSLSLLIAERQVGVPEWQPNYSQRVCMGLWAFLGCLLWIFHSVFFAKKCGSPLLFLNHQIPWPNWIIAQSIPDNEFYSNYTIYTALWKRFEQPRISPPSVRDFNARSVLVGCVCLNNMQRCLK